MPDSSNNNTTELSENGTIGTRDFSSMTATMLSTEVSRHNYQTMSDAKLDEFRKTVYKLVSTWELESKLRILSEYGDASFLKKNASVDDINKQVTETLIIHLSPNDLRQLVSDTYVSERKLKQEVKKAQTQRRKAGTGFNTRTFAEVAEVSRGADNTKQILAAIKTVDREYSIPKDILSQFKRLRKELKDVLETCFNKVELGALAAQMGIEIKSSDAKHLMKAITNKTILYVALITGKSKSANMANAFVDPEPYNNLLQYTSYSYITGKPGMSANEWSELKNKARRAKAQVQVVSRLRKERAKKTDSEFLRLSGGASSAKDIALNDNGILADASYDQLLELAGRYGIDIKKRSIGDLKLELYRAIAADNNRRSKISGIIGRAETKGKFAKGVLYDELSIRSSYSPMDSTGNTGSGGNPIVKFDDSGNLKTKSILSAMPVYIVGNGVPGTTPEGAKLGKKILGSISDGNTDVSIKSVTQLDPKDLSLYNQILAMDEAALANQQSILEEKYGVRDVIFTAISDKPLTYRRNAIAWLTASCMKRPKLASYIYNKYDIRFTNYRKFGSEIKRKAIRGALGVAGGSVGNFLFVTASIGGGMLGAAALPVAAGAIVGTIRAIKSARAKSIDELAQNEQDYYYGLRKISIDDLMNAVSQYYNRAITQRYLDKIKDESKKDYLIALLARKKGYNNLYRFLFKKIGADKTMIPQNQGKNFSNVRAWFSRVFKANNLFQNAFGKKGRTNNADEGLVEPENNSGKSSADLTKGSVKSTIVGVDMTRPQYKKIHVVEDVTSLVKKQKDGKAKKSEKKTKDPHLLAVRTFDVTSTAIESVKVSDASSIAEGLGINSVLKKAATPVYVINSKLSTSDDNLKTSIEDKFSSLFLGLAAETVAAPMGTGVIARPSLISSGIAAQITQAANRAANLTHLMKTTGITTKSNTGATITRMPTGGTVSITGDAAGSNIFANGAKPELVTSTGDMTITPLRKSKDVSQKVNRMTQAERNSALATSISSHVIRMAYNLPSGISDLSNPGEAIKVYNVKPGITDQISIGNGQTTSLIGLLGSIYSQLIAINSGATVGNQLLTTIAANTTITKAASSTASSGNPFAGGFPTNLDAILQGE